MDYYKYDGEAAVCDFRGMIPLPVWEHEMPQCSRWVEEAIAKGGILHYRLYSPDGDLAIGFDESTGKHVVVLPDLAARFSTPFRLARAMRFYLRSDLPLPATIAETKTLLAYANS